ncbi:triacylglycerol lipase 4 [[Candida] anglica]|uniref:Triacylglycerol lipase 4 n=1 Tax=[Candida] anglica TaxID=148631 RepID=A0ABP0EJA8_9ASCO
MEDIISSRLDSSGITDSIFSKHSEFILESVAARADAKKNASWFFQALQLIQSGTKAGAHLPSLHSIPLIKNFVPAADPNEQHIQDLLYQQKLATNYKQWYKICLQLDNLLNNETWKLDPKSDLYDYELVSRQLTQMKNARLSHDYKLLLYLVRTTWTRNVGNMGDVNLYRHSYVGTKSLIEEYIAECELSLDYLVNDDAVNLDDRYLLGMLIQTRKNIGRTALVLSGGSTFGIFHIGVLASLLESHLLPRIVSGSSAGSIMASILCSCTNEETLNLLNTICERKFNIFGEEDMPDLEVDPKAKYGRGTLKKLAHFLKYGTLFDISGLKNTMIDFVGELTFREAYNRTGKILNITVSPASIHEQTRLLNYLTAPNCLIWSAVCASCSLPGIFPSTSIYEKNPRTGESQEWNNDTSVKYVDGSVDNDLPITRLSEMFNVDHIIACQVNPHVVPFLKMSVTCVGGEIENEVSSRMKNFLTNVYDFMASEVIHYLEVLHECGVGSNLSTKLISILSQQYSGDITILPDFNIKDFTKIFENPTPEFLLECIVRGARASWPKITVIKNHCGVEFALDKAISLLRGKLITGNRGIDNGLSLNTGSFNGRSKLDSNKITSYSASSAFNSNSFSGNVANSEYTLVSSPILNFDSETPSPVPEQTRPHIMKRHNTVSSTAFRDKSGNKAKPQRNSISSYTPHFEEQAKKIRATLKKVPLKNPNFPNVSKARGKSTTSLVGMTSTSGKDHDNDTEEENIKSSPILRKHGRANSYYSPENSDLYGRYNGFQEESARSKSPLATSQGQTLGLGVVTGTGRSQTEGDEISDDQQNTLQSQARMVRKAKSSGNFYALENNGGSEGNAHLFENSRQLKYETERIPYYKGNPYLDTPTLSDNTSNGSTSPLCSTTSKANLPSKRVSTSNSLRGSYVGLNRLKENKSTNGSYLNLKELGYDDESYQKQLMNLTSPDIRRGYRGTRMVLSRQNSEGVSLLINKLAKEQEKQKGRRKSEELKSESSSKSEDSYESETEKESSDPVKSSSEELGDHEEEEGKDEDEDEELVESEGDSTTATNDGTKHSDDDNNDD